MTKQLANSDTGNSDASPARVWSTFATLFAASAFLLTGCSPAAIAPAESATKEESLLRRRLAAGPVCYRWQETLGGESIDHHGHVLFLLADDRIFSRAWFDRGEFIRAWPAVEGAGTLTGDTIELVYRSASGLPEHEFYIAECRFKMSVDGTSFRCEFSQQAEPQAQELATGAAIGELQTPPSPGGSEFELHAERVRQMSKR